MGAEISAVTYGQKKIVRDPDVGLKCQLYWCGCCQWWLCNGPAQCYHGCVTTQKLREKFGMEKRNSCTKCKCNYRPCVDCLVAYYCGPCTLAQQHKFLRTKFQSEKWGQL